MPGLRPFFRKALFFPYLSGDDAEAIGMLLAIAFRLRLHLPVLAFVQPPLPVAFRSESAVKPLKARLTDKSQLLNVYAQIPIINEWLVCCYSRFRSLRNVGDVLPAFFSKACSPSCLR